MKQVHAVYARDGHLVKVDPEAWTDKVEQETLAKVIGGRVVPSTPRREWHWVPPVARYLP